MRHLLLLGEAPVDEGREHARQGSGNRAIEGSLLAIDGAIDDDQGALESADEKLRLARRCFEESREPRLLARTLIQLAYIWMDADPNKSLEYLLLVGPFIPPDDKRLQILAESTRIDCLITLGSTAEALRRFMNLAEIWDQFPDPFFQLRRRFMAGRLLEGLGRYVEADTMFREVIAVDLEEPVGSLVQVQQRRLVGVRPVDHGPELEHRERSAVSADPPLAEEDWSRRISLDQKRDHQPGRSEQHDEQECTDDIEGALHAGLRLILFHANAVGEPRAERDLGHHEIACAEFAVLHVRLLPFD